MTEAEKKAERQAKANKANEVSNLLQQHLDGLDGVVVGAALTRLIAIWIGLYNADNGDEADTMLLRVQMLAHMASTAMSLAHDEDKRRTKH